MTPESRVLRAIRLGLPRRLPGCVVWRNSVGVARYERPGGVVRVPYGLCVGAADLVGVYRGRFIGVEVKAKRGRSSPEQVLWAALVRRAGGVAVVARSLDEAVSGIEEAMGS